MTAAPPGCGALGPPARTKEPRRPANFHHKTCSVITLRGGARDIRLFWQRAGGGLGLESSLRHLVVRRGPGVQSPAYAMRHAFGARGGSGSSKRGPGVGPAVELGFGIRYYKAALATATGECRGRPRPHGCGCPEAGLRLRRGPAAYRGAGARARGACSCSRSEFGLTATATHDSPPPAVRSPRAPVASGQWPVEPAPSPDPRPSSPPAPAPSTRHPALSSQQAPAKPTCNNSDLESFVFCCRRCAY
jgi:hypothetical protein